MQFGFVGLGQMGHPMATNLSKKHNVLIPDRPSNPSFLNRVNVATDTRDFSQCNVLILCLHNGAIVKSVLFAEDGIAKYLKPGTIIVDTSTIEYRATLEVDASLHEMGLKFLDAPISGMRTRAEKGTLTLWPWRSVERESLHRLTGLSSCESDSQVQVSQV